MIILLTPGCHHGIWWGNPGNLPKTWPRGPKCGQRIENTKFAQYLLYSTLFFAGPSENAVREQAEAMALVETGSIVQEDGGMELDNAAKQEAEAEAMCMFASLIAS